MTPDADQPEFTYGDYLRWSGDERWELIDGKASLIPATRRAHQAVVGELFRQISNVLIKNGLLESGGPCRAYVAPFDVRLPQANEADESIDTVVQPDISVICDPEKLDTLGCKGAPTWIIEVLSASTAVRDQILKRDLYARHGVREASASGRSAAHALSPRRRIPSVWPGGNRRSQWNHSVARPARSQRPVGPSFCPP